MRKIKIKDPSGYSFLFWLSLPLIFTWLAASYLFGSFKAYNLQGKQIELQQVSLEQAVPVQPTFPPLPASRNGYATLWFDDAWLSQYLVAFPQMKSFGYSGAIAVPLEAVEKPNYVNWAQLNYLSRAGWEITSHTVSHDCGMQDWGQEDIEKELKLSQQMLWNYKLGADIFVSPCGVDSPTLRQEVKKRFLAFRTVDPGTNDLAQLDPFALKVRNIDNQVTIEEIKSWIDTAATQRAWVILVFHQIDQQDNQDAEKYNISKDNFNKLLEYIKTKGMPVVVPSQVLNAVASS